MACQAPGLTFVTGTVSDDGMDPFSKYLSLVDASRFYKMLGEDETIDEERMPNPGEALIDVKIGFCVRKGTHYMSIEDWNVFMDLFNKNM